VIAEEEVAAGRIPAHGDTYFLVDPLDGTKEFVRGGDDYTVNIGLIVGGTPRWAWSMRPSSDGRLAQLVEHLVYTERVGGSSPSAPTRAG
jgi:3'(2'), 5'-bisphosphate nucleotidase